MNNSNNKRKLNELITSSELKNRHLNVSVALRKLRIKRGYQCGEYFVNEFDFNRSAYYGWENGKNITLTNLILVCEALDITLFDFFKMVKMPKKKKRIGSHR